MDSSSEEIVSSSSSPTKRVCKHCNRKFTCGRALGGHIRTHNIKIRFSNNNKSPRTTTRRKSISNNNNNNNNYFLLSWKVHKKRGSNQQVVEESIKKPKTQENDDDEEEVENEVEKEESNGDDDYQEDSSEKRVLLERLKEFDKTKHKISRKIRERYVCHTCKMVFPTFHAVSCHVHEKINNHNHLSSNSLSSSPSPTTTTVNDNNNKVGKLVINNFNDEHVKNNSESKFNKGVAVNDSNNINNPPTIRRMLDFDLNELPHAEEDK